MSTTFRSVSGPYNWINNQRVSPVDTSAGVINDLEPRSGKLLAKVPVSGTSDVDTAVQAAKNAFQSWSKVQLGLMRSQWFWQISIPISNIKDSLCPHSHAGTGGDWWGTGIAPPQLLADQLTLFLLGEGRLCPPITTAPSLKVFPLLVFVHSFYKKSRKYFKYFSIGKYTIYLIWLLWCWKNVIKIC